MTVQWVKASVAICCGCVLGGCSGSKTSGLSLPRSSFQNRKIELIQRSFVPRSTAAHGYGIAGRQELSPFESAILREVEKFSVSHEPSLSALTRDLAVAMDDSYTAAPGLVEGLLAWHGRSHPPPQFLITGIDGELSPCKKTQVEPCESLIKAIAKEAHQIIGKRDSVVVGVGVGSAKPGITRIVVALLDPAVKISPLSNQIDPRSSTTLSGKLAVGYSQPRLEIIDPNGLWSNLEPRKTKKNGFDANLNCSSGRGTYQIELLAEGAYGPEVVANFPLYCLSRPPKSIDYTLEHISDRITVAELEQENFRVLNQARALRGLAPIAWDSQAAKIARGHSLDMAQHSFVGHRSTTTGDVVQRFSQSKLQAAVLRENVARGYGPYSIHESLISSPGHRANILADDVTHVGIGIVVGESKREGVALGRPLFLTQNFYAKVDVRGPKNLRKSLQEAANDHRKRFGHAPIRWNEKIGSIAQQYAKQLAENRNTHSLEQVQSLVFALGYGYVDFHKVEAGSWQSLLNLELWAKLKRGATGVGVERMISGGNDVGFIVIAIVALEGRSRSM